MATFTYLKRILFVFLSLTLLMSILLISGFVYYLTTPSEDKADDRIFLIADGSTLSDVSDTLRDSGLISCKHAFLVYARTAGYSNRMKAGEYRLNPAMTPLMILDILSQGKIISHPITIPEGYSIKQISKLLAQAGLASEDDFMKIADSTRSAQNYGFNTPNLEGFLYPDTYHFSRGLSVKSMIDVMINRFHEITAPFAEKLKASKMTLEQVVILASIVEKETGRAAERPQIAAVFLNRLKKKGRLESDPTVIYGIDDFNGNLTKKDLRTKTPYNTYIIRGLPPGAIANPGKDAIHAVLFPEDSDYYYFVSKNDGSHHFSKTLAEHNRAVKIYQKNRRSRNYPKPAS